MSVVERTLGIAERFHHRDNQADAANLPDTQSLDGVEHARDLVASAKERTVGYSQQSGGDCGVAVNDI